MPQVNANVAIVSHGYAATVNGVIIGNRHDNLNRVRLAQHAGLPLTGDIAKFGLADGAVQIPIVAPAITPTPAQARSEARTFVQNRLGSANWDLSANEITLPIGHRLHPTHGWVPTAGAAPADFAFAFQLELSGATYRRDFDVYMADGITIQPFTIDFLVVVQSYATS